ncbi:LysR family transcriptional regulator [Ensifer sp. ENS05]|nr:LysR family transcriptional regulator [Ensifer sp. ENS05]
MRYDLTDLRLFANIAECASLTRGAERSHLSLSAASMRLKGLEEALEVKLFIRRSNGVELTPAGRTLFANAHQVFQQLEKLHGDLLYFSKALKGTVRIFANTTAISENLPSALSQFMTLNPEIDIDLEERLSPEIVRAVSDGVIDIGILAGTVENTNLRFLPFKRDRLVLAAAPGHPLSGFKEVSFNQTVEYNFVSLHRDSALHDFLQHVATAAGVDLKVRIRVAGFDALCRMVEAGVGIALLPASVAKRLSQSHRFHAIELLDSWAIRDLRICVRDVDALPTFAQKLIEHLLSTVKDD